MGLQAQIIEYLESKGWYFDWDHINEVWDEDSPTSLNKRPDAIRTLHGWTLPQWGNYWQTTEDKRKRRYEDLKDVLWSQLLREEEPEQYAFFFQETD